MVLLYILYSEKNKVKKIFYFILLLKENKCKWNYCIIYYEDKNSIDIPLHFFLIIQINNNLKRFNDIIR